MTGRQRNQSLLICQSGGPTAVINASLVGAIEAARATADVDRVLGARYGITGVIERDIVDLEREDEATIASLREAPGSALGSARREVTEDDYERILDALNVYDVGYFLLIGGNGTMALAGEIHDRADDAALDVRTVGVPKTVDNDITATDHCPGYGSAARYYAVTVREVGRDVESLPPPVTIFETMGRDTGWLAASTALAGPEPESPPHLVYLPERPFDEERFLHDVAAVHEEHGYAFVAVGEGLRDTNGNAVAMDISEARRDATGKPLPGGVGERLADLVSSELGLRARCEKPGLCGRSSIAMQSAVDRREAERVGEAAVARALAGETDAMMALRRTDASEYEATIETVSLDEITGMQAVPDRYIAEDGNYVTEEFLEYARPLAGGPLPKYARLQGVPVDLKDG